jgi:hypothetical protein
LAIACCDTPARTRSSFRMAGSGSPRRILASYKRSSNVPAMLFLSIRGTSQSRILAHLLTPTAVGVDRLAQTWYGRVVKEPKLPRHDHIEREPAGDGWTAHVAFRGQRIVGVVVVPTDARSVPPRFDPRDIHVAGARVRAATKVQGSAVEVAPSPGPEDRLTGGPLYRWVAHLVLLAQAEGQPRFNYVRDHLEELGVDLGRSKEVKVKNLIRRATDAGYLAKTQRGRGPRRPGPKLPDARADAIATPATVAAVAAVPVPTAKREEWRKAAKEEETS